MIRACASILWKHAAALCTRTERMRFLRYADTYCVVKEEKGTCVVRNKMLSETGKEPECQRSNN